ncbi:hypothetical protein ADU90_09175 [Clostridium botulinum]|uniref:CRISPR-associated protein Csc3 n=1 Tax=Clostridium botulinum C/D str. DC5 TaxID=1443128 RepID=A0A0A0HYA3_CLOBO|nr:type I-D CRISPR-associated protein Cas10d/Csc3 [Clostridium botulinum]KGM92896.1 hypothetical protein Z956_13215 [Clostridium botulinum D str. CCUG 7971]KGM93046.1 hypothetical protein Z955_16085 [Clostridium botulinum C/D str. DC5]KOC47192.1 hypothetical protein ADU88_10835 [Clostridium botulinum]KOC51514.1 hypothetical protein ADU89_13365 [Clostridium botulinum]KOC56020.1 hypothetical protein ADU90_09175 [Clostridium botulinum]
MRLASLKETSIFNDYYEKIVDKNLKQYKSIVQYGMKKNQTLYSHVLNMIGVLEEIKDIVKLNNLELKVLITAITIHDINKIDEHEGKGYLRIISEENKSGQYENIVNECKKVGIVEFFPEYMEYINDIRAIIGQHSAHTESFTEGLFCKGKDYKLGDKNIERLVSIIRALDIIDLSKNIDEKEKKRQFLVNLNNATKYFNKTYKMITHKISEDRGILTNLCHNAIVKFLKEKGFIAIAYYKEGVVYLVENVEINFSEDDRKNLISYCVKAVKETIYSDFRTFIKNTPAGIKVDEKCLDIASVEDIVYEIKNRCNTCKIPDINKQNDKIKKFIEERKSIYSSQKLQNIINIISKLKDDIENTKDKKALKTLEKELKANKMRLREQRAGKEIQEREEDESYFIQHNEEGIRFSEFIRTLYIFINMHIYNKKTDVSWSEMYKFFDIKEETIDYLNIFDGLYQRPYILGQMIYEEYKDREEDLINRIIEYLEKELQSHKDKSEDAMWIDLGDYFNKNIILSFDKNIISRLKRENLLKSYAEKVGTKCCLCSSEYDTSNWMAVDRPYQLKIQNFSNKINAGYGEPKRNICSICKIEYLLHKVNYSSKVEVSRRYLSIFPRSFNTNSYIRAFRESMKEFKYKDVSALYFNDYTTFVEQADKHVQEIEPVFSKAKVNGVPIPNYSETLTNYFILPIHLVKNESETVKWISSLIYALTFNIYFDSQIVVSQFPVAILDKEDIEEIYIGDVPVPFKNIFEKRWSKEEVEKTIKLFTNLFVMAKTLGETNEFVHGLLKALAKGRLNFIYSLYKKLKDKYENPSFKIQEISTWIEDILSYVEEDEKIVSKIKELALLGFQNNIRGSITGGFIKDNAINKPLNIIIDILCRCDEHIYTSEDIKALSKREVQRYFERVDSYYGNKKIQAIEEYVDFFIDKIFIEMLEGKTFNLDNEKKNIVSTYSYYYRLEMAKTNKNRSEK